jgi:hypothetical protein
MSARARPTRRRVVGCAVLAVATLVFAELAAYAGLWALDGKPTGLAGLRQARHDRAETGTADGAGDEETAAPQAGDLATVLRHGGYEVLQPYLGFVWTPEADLTDNRYLSKLQIDRYGFLVDPRDRPADGAPEPIEVGIFGGSVANILHLAGRQPLLRVLGEDPAIAARGVVVRNYALPGYKQPQQLMALAWLRSLGRAPDVVVNLDGFNEVALPPTENVPFGTHPLYPRSWTPRLEGLPDLESQRAAGEVSYLRQRRREVARSFERPLLAHSALWNLLWTSRDRRLEVAVAEAEERLAEASRGGGSYVAHGPAYAATDERMHQDLVTAWSAASRAMRAVAEDAGIPYHHFLQPNQYLAGTKPLSREERTLYVTPGHGYGEQVIAAYPLLIEAGERLRRQGVAFHDLTQLFAGEERTVYSDDCCHLNAYGNRLLARAVAAAIRDDVAAVARRPPERGPRAGRAFASPTSAARSVAAARPPRRSSGSGSRAAR